LRLSRQSEIRNRTKRVQSGLPKHIEKGSLEKQPLYLKIQVQYIDSTDEKCRKTVTFEKNYLESFLPKKFLFIDYKMQY